MVNRPNTIYEIRYDFDLNGETIEIPEGCTLKFDGGSLKNGTLKGYNTAIFGFSRIQYLYLTGTFSPINADFFISNWDDVSHELNHIASCCRDIDATLVLSSRVYKICEPIDFSKISIIGNGALIKVMKQMDYAVASMHYKQNLSISNLVIDCNKLSNKAFYIYDMNDTLISNIRLINFLESGFHISGGSGIQICNFYIQACKESKEYCRGIYSCKPDCIYNSGNIEFCPVCIDTVGGNFSNIHMWGLPNIHNANIGILQRHTNVQITNCEFDSIVSLDNSNKNPWDKINDETVPYKEVYQGGSAILSMMDNFCVLNCKLATNTNVDFSGSNIPYFISMLDGNYFFVELGTSISAGYNIQKYKLRDINSLYKSKRLHNVLVSNISDIKEFCDGELYIEDEQLYVGNRGRMMSVGTQKYKIDSYLLYKICDLSQLNTWERQYLNLKINISPTSYYEYDIGICKQGYNDIGKDIGIISRKEINNNIKFLYKDECLYFYADLNYSNYLFGEINILTNKVYFKKYKSTTDISEYQIISVLDLYKVLYKKKYGITSDRPDDVDVGFQYFDTILGKPIYYNGNKTWVDANGDEV